MKYPTLRLRFQTQLYTEAQDSTKNQSLMLRHILRKRKPSSTHITPLVTHRVLKKVLSKEKHLGSLESYEQTPQKLRLRITFQISTLIENLLSDIKCTEIGNALLKQNKEKKEVLPFVTQYQPSVSPLKEVLMQTENGILYKSNRYFAKFLKNHRSFLTRKENP